jgi:hypothetical protein
MRQIRTSGSMSERWKRGKGGLVRHRQPKGPGTDRPSLNHRATSRLYSTPDSIPHLRGSLVGEVRDRAITVDGIADALR